MPAELLLVPPVVLVIGALLTWTLGFGGLPSRLPGAAVVWLALIVLVLAWIGVGRQPTELSTPIAAEPLPIVLRMDALSFAIGLVVLSTAALLLTFQPWQWEEAGAATLATAFAMVAVEADSLALTALALGACAAMVTMILRQELEQSARSAWLALLLASLILLWGAAALVTFSGGTSLFSAVPVQAFKWQVFVLIAIPAVLCSGLVPWRTWVSEVWSRPKLGGAGIGVGLLVPLGFLLLLRTYTLGGGQWPVSWLHWVLSVLGLLVALAAALRAQAAPDHRSQLGETVPLAGGLALLALSLGTPLGVAAAVTGVAATGLAVALGMVLPAGGRVTLLGIPLVVGAPPGLTFGARLLTVQAALEAGSGQALLTVGIVAAWFLGYIAAARAAWLPPGAGRGSRAGALVASAAIIGAGAGLGALEQFIAVPAAEAVLSLQTTPISAGVGEVTTASGTFDALPLAIPFAVLLVLFAFFTRPLGLASQRREIRALLRLRMPALPEGLGDQLRALPSLVRSSVRLGTPERLMTQGSIWLWVVVAVVLLVVVTR
ncbi:MAG TPA: hypothetical protein VIA06_17335 [Candidatus Dormibacteraeota bacterium]|nr:hypothetical protein [Candidatus Dormibacteraeota bacterium]